MFYNHKKLILYGASLIFLLSPNAVFAADLMLPNANSAPSVKYLETGNLESTTKIYTLPDHSFSPTKATNEILVPDGWQIRLGTWANNLYENNKYFRWLSDHPWVPAVVGAIPLAVYGIAVSGIGAAIGTAVRTATAVWSSSKVIRATFGATAQVVAYKFTSGEHSVLGYVSSAVGGAVAALLPGKILLKYIAYYSSINMGISFLSGDDVKEILYIGFISIPLAYISFKFLPKINIKTGRPPVRLLVKNFFGKYTLRESMRAIGDTIINMVPDTAKRVFNKITKVFKHND